MIISRIIIPSSNFYVPRPSTNDLPKCKELIICAIQTSLIPIIILNQSLVTGVTRPTSSSHAYRTKIQAMFVMQLKHSKKSTIRKTKKHVQNPTLHSRKTYDAGKTYAICTILTAELSEAMRHQFVFENRIALVPSTAMALQCFIQTFIATWHE